MKDITDDSFFNRCITNQVIPKNDAEKQIILKIIIKKEFELGKTYTDEEVREKLKKYFPDEYPTIRREFVNWGYMHIDSLKGLYKLVKAELKEEDYRSNSRLMKAAVEAGLMNKE